MPGGKQRQTDGQQAGDRKKAAPDSMRSAPGAQFIDCTAPADHAVGRDAPSARRAAETGRREPATTQSATETGGRVASHRPRLEDHPAARYFPALFFRRAAQ